MRPGWYDEAAVAVEKDATPGFRMLAARGGRHGEDAGFIGGASGEFLYGRFYGRDRLDEIDLRDELVAVAGAARPVLDSLIALAKGEVEPAPRVVGDEPLVALAEEFRRWGYPSAADEKDRTDRAYFASLLLEGTLPDQDPRELGKIWNTGRYGGPGPMAALNRSVQDTATYERLLDTFGYLCHGDGDDADRIDTVLDDPRWKVPGLGESVVMKLLAITHPERYLAVFPYKGEKGKQRLLHLLSLPEPTGISRGHIQVEANDLLRRRVEALFPGDSWGMTRFLFWYAARAPQQEEASDEQSDPIADLAEELLLDRSFLDDLVDLLGDKGQVILYGPPGTGQDLPREEARRGARAGPAPAEHRPVPSVDVLRGLLRGVPARDDVNGAVTYAPDRRARSRVLADRGRGRPGRPPRHAHRRDQPRRTCRRSSASCCSSSSTGASRSARFTGPTRRSSCRPTCGSSAR